LTGLAPGRWRIAIFCCLILLSAPLITSASETLLLALDDAVSRALQENLELKAQQYETNASRWGQAEAWSNWLPQVGFSTDYTRLDEETVIRSNSFLTLFPIFEEIFPGFTYDPNQLPTAAFKGSYLSSVAVSQALYNGGAEWGGIRAAAASRRLAQYTLEDKRQDIILKTQSAYYNVLKAHELSELMQQSLEFARENLESAQRKENLGLLSRSDILRWEVQVADLDNRSIEAQNGLELADLSLKNIAMIPPETTLQVVPLSAEERDRLSEEIMGESDDPPELAPHHPALGMASSVTDLESANLWTAWGGFQPKVNFVWSYSWEQDDDLALDGFTSWAAVLSVRIPLFTGFGNVARVQQAKWRLRKSRMDFRNIQQNLSLAYRYAQLKLHSAAKRITSAKKVLEQARENLGIMQNRYDLGLVSNLELIDVQIAHRDANMNYINALYDYLLAKVEAARARGDLSYPSK
jgi:outer membrane protein